MRHGTNAWVFGLGLSLILWNGVPAPVAQCDGVPAPSGDCVKAGAVQRGCSIQAGRLPRGTTERN